MKESRFQKSVTAASVPVISRKVDDHIGLARCPND